MIEVQGLTKLYGTVEAVRDPSFGVAPGEVLGLVGPNGAGKTTTRGLSPRSLVLIAVLVVFGSTALASGSLRALDLVTVILLASGGVTLFFGPLATRCDLRQDLEMLDVLKSYPVRGYEVVRGEVAAPVVLIGVGRLRGVRGPHRRGAAAARRSARAARRAGPGVGRYSYWSRTRRCCCFPLG